MIRPELMVFWRRVEAADARIPVLRICAVKVVEAVFVSRLNFGNDDAVLAVTIQTLLFAQTCLCVCGRTDKFPLAPTVRHCILHCFTLAHADKAVGAVIIITVKLEHMLSINLNRIGRNAAVRIAHYAEVLIVVFTGISIDNSFQRRCLCAFIVSFFF